MQQCFFQIQGCLHAGKNTDNLTGEQVKIQNIDNITMATTELATFLYKNDGLD